MKKKAASKGASPDDRSSEQIRQDVAASLNGLSALLKEHDRSRKLRDLLKTIIAEAEAGSKENAARVLHLAMDCTAWLEKRVAAEDPLVLALAKSVPAWPTLFYPHQRSVSLPTTLGIEYEAVDVVKLARQNSIPREVAWRLLRLVDLIQKSTEALVYEKNLEKILGEFEILDAFGKDGTETFNNSMRPELEHWKADFKRLQNMMLQTSDNLARFLAVENILPGSDLLDKHINEFIFLPTKDAPEAVDRWWGLAKKLFLRFTEDHPERCEILKNVARSKADAYLRDFPGKQKGAASRQKAGIVREVGQAFKAIFRVSDEKPMKV